MYPGCGVTGTEAQPAARAPTRRLTQLAKDDEVAEVTMAEIEAVGHTRRIAARVATYLMCQSCLP